LDDYEDLFESGILKEAPSSFERNSAFKNLEDVCPDKYIHRGGLMKYNLVVEVISHHDKFWNFVFKYRRK